MVIAQGNLHDVISQVVRGASVGTRFPAPADHLESRKRWLLAERTQAALIVDKGAADRLYNGGASLLPVGMVAVEGTFDRGEPVQVKTIDGRPIAIGLSNYDSKDAQKLTRQQSGAIRELLGYSYGDEIIHRDNLALYYIPNQ